MLNSINSDLIRGHIDTIILSVLHEGDRYGYDILGEIEKKSNGQYSLKQPTLYSCLKRLEGQGFIYKYWGAETNGGRRTYYSLTEMGKELFKRNKDEWEHSRGIIDKLISSPDSPVKPYIVADVSAAPSDTEAEQPEAANEIRENISAATEDKTQTDKESAPQDEPTSARYADILAEAEKNELLKESETTMSYGMGASDDLRGVSYADKLQEDAKSEKHEETERDQSLINSVYMSDNVSDYFKDYDDDETETAERYVNASDNLTETKTEEALHSDVVDTQPDKTVNISESDENLDEHKEIVKPVYDDKEHLFRSYSDAELSEETDREIIVAREYRNIIRQLLKGGRNDDAPSEYGQQSSDFDRSESESQVAASVADGNEYRVHDDGRADFSNLLVAVRSMGDDIRIRTHNSNTDKEYSNLYHYYSNKLLLYKYGILFLLMICEIVIPYLIIRFAIGLEIKYELLTLVLTVVGSAILPIYAVSANLIDPYKKKRYNFELKNSLLFRLAIMVLMFVLIYAVNVVLYMDISFDAEYAFSLVVPALLSTNIPLSALIFQALYDTKKFNAE